MKQYTIPEFAKKIRAQYPGSYDDISDKKLIELWLKKYPKDKEHVIEESKSGWGTYLIYVLAIWGGLSLINNKVTPIGFVKKINTELFGSSSNSTNKNNQEVVPNNQNNEETITEDNSPDEINDEPIQNEVNSQTETEDNSSSNTYQEPERQQPEKVNCYSCRGSGNCGKCSKTCSKPYYQGNGSYKWRNETKPGYTMCQDCFGRGHKQSHVVGGSGWEPNGDCYVSGCEDGWVNCRECNGSGNGTLLGKCRDCKGTGYRN